MSTAILLTKPAPTVGEIWQTTEDSAPVIVTGVIDDSTTVVHFSNLESEAFEADLGFFTGAFKRR